MGRKIHTGRHSNR